LAESRNVPTRTDPTVIVDRQRDRASDVDLRRDRASDVEPGSPAVIGPCRQRSIAHGSIPHGSMP